MTPSLALGPLAGRSFDALLFDLDGTLIGSTPAVERSWRRWAAEYGLGPGEFEFVHGTPAAALAGRYVGADRLPAAVARIEALEVADTAGVVLLPGAAGLLASVPAGRWAIATSCTRPLAAARLAAAGLAAPAVVVTFDDVERGKPHPDPFLLAAHRLGADPARCLVFEDAPAGVQSARAAGCAVLAVAGTHPRLSADLTLESLAGLSVETDGGGRLRLVLDAH